MRDATPEELERWDQIIATNPDGGNPLQCRAFGGTKAKFGWKPRYIIHEHVAALYLVKQLPLAHLWYCPKGPGVRDVDQLGEVTTDLSTHLKGAFLVKLEPEVSAEAKIGSVGLQKAKRDIQLNASTVIVDIKPNEENLLISLKQKTRYNIRQAQKRGVVVVPVDPSPENLDKMYELMSATRDRAGFFLRSPEYFKTFWWEHSKLGTGQLFFAKFGDKVLAGAYITYVGKNALYKDGGSTRENPELQAPYALHWEIIRWLKAKGIENYDLHGTPPSNRLEDPTHSLSSLVQFKTGFGPVTDYIGTCDLVLNKPLYKLWTLAGERVHSAYRFRVKKELFY